MEAKGWAVILRDEIIVRTVSLHRIGAIVNWLYITPIPYGRVITDTHTDEQIEKWWAEEIERHGALLRVVEVTIVA